MQAKLKTLHEVVVRNRLEQLRKRQRDEALQAQEELLAGVAKSAARGDRHVGFEVDAPQQETVADEDIEPYDRSMSPALLDIRKLPYDEREIDIVTEMEDLRAIVSCHFAQGFRLPLTLLQLEQRRSVAASRFVAKTAQATADVVKPQDPEAKAIADMQSEALYRMEAERDMDEEEELFNTEENISHPITYNWEDKYRPRKPRYFNRVHTGYEWNKYNQTHYE